MGFRELLLLAITAGLSLAALRFPKIGIMAYVWYGLMRPDFHAFVPDKYPLSFALLACTALGSIRSIPGIPELFKSRFTKLVLLMQIPILLSVLTAAHPELSYDRYTAFVKLVIGAFLIPLLIRTPRDMIQMMLVYGAAVGALGLKYGGFSIANGGVIMQYNDYGNLYDDNTLALTLVAIVPMCWYGREMITSRLLRLVLTLMVGAAVITVISTSSRGASIALGVTVLLLAVRSRNKLATVATIAIFAGVALYYLYEPYKARMETLEDPTQETSANSRLVLARVAMVVAMDHPLLGVGFGGKNFAAAASRYLPEDYLFGRDFNVTVVHNTYLGMLTDSGFIALALFVAILGGQVWWLGGSIRRAREFHPDLVGIPLALQTSLIAVCIGGFFYSLQAFDPLYLLILVVITWELLQNRLIEEDSSPEQDEVAAEWLEPANAQ